MQFVNYFKFSSSKEIIKKPKMNNLGEKDMKTEEIEI